MSGNRLRRVRPIEPARRNKRPDRSAWLNEALQAKIAKIAAHLDRNRQQDGENGLYATRQKAPGLATGGSAGSVDEAPD
jgi:hypothetical protein